MEGSGRGLILDTIPKFAWKSWRKPRKPSNSETLQIYGWRLERVNRVIDTADLNRQYCAMNTVHSSSYFIYAFGLSQIFGPMFIFFFFFIPVCAITASGGPGCTFVSMNRFSTLCGWLAQREGWRVKGWLWPSEQPKSAKVNSWLDYQIGDRKL
jgi:hypothetical protein